jgi:Kef-type K+ transport system membrane component KefB
MELLISPQFQMSALLFFALAGYALATRIGQSAVIGEILVGIIVGPSLLGLVNYTDFVRELADLGAIFLLFVIGLEFELKEVFKPRYLLIALCGLILPWFAGYFLMLVLGYGGMEALFVGAALTATSIAITANVLKEQGALESPVAKAIIGAAVIDDVLGLLVLSATIGVSEGQFSAGALLALLGKTLLFFGVGAVLGYLGLRRFIDWLGHTKLAKAHPETPFILSMAIAFAYAAAAEWVGLSAIVGAFLAGACLGGERPSAPARPWAESPASGVSSREGGAESPLNADYKQGAEYLRIIFSSIFFVSLGVIVDLRAVDPSILVLIAALTLAAIAAKVAGCALPARMLGYSAKESMAIGIGMAPRGEVAMIVALLGLEAGVVEQGVYVAIIVMSLLSTVFAPPLLKRLARRKSAG